MSEDYREQMQDFTESAYRTLIRSAARRYRFIAFDEHDEPGKTILWRHDIDFSPHRARALARIEKDEGVLATYFVLLHSDFYNALELEVVRILQEIAGLGHRIGLHFTPGFYETAGPHFRNTLEQPLRDEARLLETVLGVQVGAFSWHMPSVGGWDQSADDDEMGGLVNAYGRSIRSRFEYCSDSHGIWRFRRLDEMLETSEVEHLHVLTHPEWWVPEAMTPRDRVSRAIEGRAAAQHRNYDAMLERIGRPNVR